MPFALENLGCTGNESSLLDCPATPDVEIDYREPYNYDYYGPAYDVNPGQCDPGARESTYAFVACGGPATAGPATSPLSVYCSVRSSEGLL